MSGPTVLSVGWVVVNGSVTVNVNVVVEMCVRLMRGAVVGAVVVHCFAKTPGTTVR